MQGTKPTIITATGQTACGVSFCPSHNANIASETGLNSLGPDSCAVNHRISDGYSWFSLDIVPQVAQGGSNPGSMVGSNPGTNPGLNPGTNLGLNPGTNPGLNPGTNLGLNPGTNPGSNPGTNLGSNPGTNPGLNLGTNPGLNPGTNPGLDPESPPQRTGGPCGWNNFV